MAYIPRYPASELSEDDCRGHRGSTQMSMQSTPKFIFVAVFSNFPSRPRAVCKQCQSGLHTVTVTCVPVDERFLLRVRL